MPGFVGGVVPGNQQLGHSVVVFAEQLVIDVHQLALSHGGGGLLGGHVLGLLPQPQLADPHADGAGGDQNDFMARVFDITDYTAQRLHPADIQMPRGVGQGGGADFDYDAHGQFLLILSINEIWHIIPFCHRRVKR